MKRNKKLVYIFLAVCVLAFSFLYIPTTSAGVMEKLDTISQNTNLPKSDVVDVLSNFLRWALEIFGILAVLAFIISGVIYLTAAGNTTQIEKAKKAMQWSIIGVVVGLGGAILVQTINDLL